MANAREIQGRIKSVKDTMKITNAMYMVSSSKLQKARRDLKNTEPYFFMIQDSLAKILDVAPEVGSAYFDGRPYRQGNDRTVAYLVLTADKGLAGAYNHNVIKLAEQKATDDGCNNVLFVVWNKVYIFSQCFANCIIFAFLLFVFDNIGLQCVKIW